MPFTRYCNDLSLQPLVPLYKWISKHLSGRQTMHCCTEFRAPFVTTFLGLAAHRIRRDPGFEPLVLPPSLPTLARAASALISGGQSTPGR